MKYSVIALLLCLNNLSFGNSLNTGEDLSALLESYQNTLDQSSKTKKESLGHIISYTSQDLHMMQAHKLSDVLKLIPVTSIQSNLYGISNLTYAGNPTGVSTSMRLYINNHEVSSLQTLSPWLIYDNYPLDHISHIEIYIGEVSLTLGNEPSNLTIKLYTKNPKLLNGGIIRGSISNNTSYNGSIVYAEENENENYLVMFNSSQLNLNTTNYNNNNLSKDSKRTFGYASITLKDYIVDTGYANLQRDTFVGLAKDASPDDGQLKSQDYFVSITKKFSDDSGKIYMAIDKNDRQFKEINAEGSLVLPVINLADAAGTIPKNYTEDLTLTKYDLSISKKFSFTSNNLFLSSNFKHKSYDINSRDTTSLNGTTSANIKFSDIEYESILSFMAENNYYFNDKNIFVMDLKYDKYFKNSGFSDFSKVSKRVGFVSMLGENFGIKSFATNSFTPPSMYEIDFAAKSVTKDLKPEEKNIYSIEAVYEDEKNRLSLYSNYIQIDNSIILDLSKLGYVNKTAPSKGGGSYIDYKRKIDYKNELDLIIYKFHNNIGVYNSSKQGAIIKAFQNLDNFDCYEELIFKDGYKYGGHTTIKDSYNLTLGLDYHINKDTVIEIKGENLLDDDMNVVYGDLSSFPQQPAKYTTIQNSDRRFTTSIKWTF